MFAITMQAGQSLSFPDVCKTPAPPAPPLPIPYPNMGMMPMGNPSTTKIFIGGMPALTKASKVPMTSGAEAGVAGGLKSGVFMQEMVFMMASLTVTFEGKGAVRSLIDQVDSNKDNTPMMGMVTVPSQMTVIAGG